VKRPSKEIFIKENAGRLDINTKGELMVEYKCLKETHW
jgi:hypothetical protein